MIGFSRGEVGAVLVGELALLTLVALPLAKRLESRAPLARALFAALVVDRWIMGYPT